MKKSFIFISSCVAILFLLSMKAVADYSPAYYPGGQTAMKNYLHDSIRYPESDRKNGIEGIVYLDFSISESGKVESARVTQSIGASATLEGEAIRLINAMPHWKPAESEGKNVASKQEAEVRFELPDSLVKLPVASGDTTVFSFAEIMPQFPGGESGMQHYLKRNIKYPQMEKEQGKAGTVYISFEIGANGKVYDVKTLKGVAGAPGLAKEGVRVIADMPRWAPATMGGKAVRCTMVIPIRFQLQ